MHQVQDSFSKLSLDGDGVITNIAWHVKSIMQGRRNEGAWGAIVPHPLILEKLEAIPVSSKNSSVNTENQNSIKSFFKRFL